MRLALIAPANSVHTRRWYSRLLSAGIDVVLITAAPADDPELEQIVVGNRNDGRWTYLKNSGRVRRLIRSLDPDIVHAFYATGHGWLGARSKFNPFIISVWGSDITITPRESWVARRLVRHSLSRADLICATSEYLARQTRTLYAETAGKIEVLPFGVDMDMFRPAEGRIYEASDLVIGAAKNLDYVYGFDILISAFRTVLDSIPGARLRIAGEGDVYRDLTALADKLQVSDRIEFVGHVKQVDMPDFLCSLDILAVPSREEAFGVASIEAMACGVPVVASDVGGNVEVLDDGRYGVLVKSESSSELAHAIVSLAADTERRKDLSVKGRQWVESRFEIGKCTERQIDLYKTILAR